MARLDAADRQGVLKVMGKLFEELAAATNASGKDIKRENNEKKDEQYQLTNQYTRKQSVRLLRFFHLITISNWDEKSFFKKNVGINDIKFAFPHLSPNPFIVP